MSDRLTVLVTGATGQQGGAVADTLHRDGHTVRALTRDPQGTAAAALAGRGIEVVGGDFTDRESLRRAAAGTDAAYLMGTPFEAGTDAEIEHGRTAIDVFRDAGVGHVVYSSVASTDRKTGIPHFESKFAVEQHLAASGVNYTISAPVFFMENHVAPWTIAALQAGNLAMALPAGRELQQIALADIGAFGARLIARRERVFGKRFDIAGDAVTGTEAAAAIGKAAGRAMAYVEVPLDAVRAQSEDLALMFEWFDNTGYAADIEALRRDFPEVGWHRFDAWAAAFDWSAYLDATAAA